MKISFLTSCLEPGCDGVGDYTTLLAAECERRGHVTQLLALNDPHASLPDAEASPQRLSSSLPWAVRVDKAAKYLDEFDPDFVSLQFVCYGFHPRGIDLCLASRLRTIIGSRPLHIMFHEIWIGAGKGEGLKNSLLGGIQRFGILRMVRSLDIRVAHTSNAAYAALLRAHGIAAYILPLFGSIPLPLPGSAGRDRGDALSLGLFGTLHPVWPPEPLISTLAGTGKKISIGHIGRIGAGEALWNKLSQDYAGLIEFKKHGEKPPEKIAEFFRGEIDFGIATTPWALIGKSATVASMLEHGLPVIVNRDDWNTDQPVPTQPSSPLLIKMDGDLLEKLSAARRAVPESRLPAVAGQFLDDIEKAFQ